jgi:hypothetical protein
MEFLLLLPCPDVVSTSSKSRNRNELKISEIGIIITSDVTSKGNMH